MNIFNSKDKLNLFLHSKSSFDILSGVNIILSPEFYWVRVFELPMTSPKEVHSALPSLFEEFIDIEGKDFYVKKMSELSSKGSLKEISLFPKNFKLEKLMDDEFNPGKNAIVVTFFLGKGNYATTVLRELIKEEIF